jgi:peptidoglycan/xylan/chitin deacetylase (PgdA/CDA1 family)
MDHARTNKRTRKPRLRLRTGRLLVLLGSVVLVFWLITGNGGSGKTAPGVSRHTSHSHPAQNARIKQETPRRNVALLTVPSTPPSRTVDVPILTWHRVAVFAKEYTKSIPDETVEPSVFREQIDALASHGYHPISQLELFDALYQGTPLPSKPVLLTVDDGYVDDVKTILPILQEHHFPATFYIISGRFHEPGFLNSTEVRRLDSAGMDIGAHTRTHVPLAAIPTSQLEGQILGSRQDLERVLGHPVQWFAYPFGSFDSTVIAEVRKAGFVLAVTTNSGTSESTKAPLSLPRIHIGRSAGVSSVLTCTSASATCGGGGG